MKKYIISYTTTMTEDALRDMMDEPTKEIDEVLDDYLWQELRPEGDDWKVMEVDE